MRMIWSRDRGRYEHLAPWAPGSVTFSRACSRSRRLVGGGARNWAIPWPCVHEFLAVATNPRAFKTTSPTSTALAQVQRWLRSPTISLLSERADHWSRLQSIIEESGIRGPRIHDARIYALCLTSGVHTLWTADRDFRSFQGLRLENPPA